MADVLHSTLFFLLALGLLVTVHEFGHYWVARRVGVKVLRFSIGYGKPIWSHQLRGGTELVIAPIPLGGYVRLLDERDEDVRREDRPFAFNRQPLWARSAVSLAGPLFNFLLAIFIYWLLAIIGSTGMRPVIGEVAPDKPAAIAGIQQGDELRAVDGHPVRTWEEALFELLKKSLNGKTVELSLLDADRQPKLSHLDLAGMPDVMNQRVLLKTLGLAPWHPRVAPVLGGLTEGGPAATAGLQAGDRLLQVNGQAFSYWDEVVDYLQARPNELLHIRIDRGGQTLDREVRLGLREVAGKQLGFFGAYAEVPEQALQSMRIEVSDSPWAALPRAVRQSWDMSAMTLRMVSKMLLGEVSIENLSGPVSIAQYAGASASIGFTAFLGFLALVSISLGVLNLLPIPILDGGHLLYYLVEFVKGSPVSEQVQQVGQQVGVVLLLGLMLLALYNDIMRMFS